MAHWLRANTDSAEDRRSVPYILIRQLQGIWYPIVASMDVCSVFLPLPLFSLFPSLLSLFLCLFLSLSHIHLPSPSQNPVCVCVYPYSQSILFMIPEAEAIPVSIDSEWIIKVCYQSIVCVRLQKEGDSDTCSGRNEPQGILLSERSWSQEKSSLVSPLS